VALRPEKINRRLIMKRFLLGLLAGIIISGLALAAQQLASEKVVQPAQVFENQKVKIIRILLKPGEGTPLHTHALDHVAVIVQGTTMKDVEPSGKSQDVVHKQGEVVYVPGTGRTHSFANTGTSPLEIVSIELK
jgi:mannose-6-phosphate isomerase-like protein (cupin superfamily)